MERDPLHILLLTDRDWTHPQGGGTGTNLWGQVSRWLDWGHRVTVIAGTYPGAERVSRPHERLEIHRMGGRMTLFARAPLASLRGVGRDADVVLEVVNGIAFFTPLWFWLRIPRVTLVHHVHHDHYVAEMGRRGRIAAFLAEHLPLRFLYQHHPFLTISRAAHDDMVEKLRLPSEQIHVSYLGVDAGDYHEAEKTPHPSLLYLGRLKQYKRLEVLLDLLETLPSQTRLEIAGDGDHRAVIEREIAERGLTEQVTLHGYVDEQEKARLYAESWVNLTASSAEGWCLTVMEAACARTPSAALAVGGLSESIVDGETGLLANTPDELAERVGELLGDHESRDRMAAQARDRAHTFTWERTAEDTLGMLQGVASAERVRLRDRLRRSETAAAAGLAAATLTNNAIQLLFTIVFTRLLGADGYGALAAIIAAFVILMVGGQSVQVAAARETALGRLGHGHGLRGTLNRWTVELLTLAVTLLVAGIAGREPLAAVLGVPEHPWAVAFLPATGALWLLLSLQRGILQGLRDYRAVGVSLVGEAVARLTFALALYAIGLGVTGAFLGNAAAFVLLIVWLGARTLRETAREVDTSPVRQVPRSVVGLVSDNWVPIVGLFALAVLQTVDVIVGRHAFDGDAAGSYAAAVTAAKAVVWVAVGVGLQLLPEATRLAAAGHDPRPALLRALGVLAVVAVPALLVFSLFPEQLLRIAFGPDLTAAASSLPVLGLAMTVLAIGYLTVQYMIALGEMRFVWVLAMIAIAEPIILSSGPMTLFGYAAVVLGVQVVAASGLLAIGLRSRRARAAQSA